jgi:hypothetical protein
MDGAGDGDGDSPKLVIVNIPNMFTQLYLNDIYETILNFNKAGHSDEDR